MQYRQLANTSLHISRIGFGCMSLKPGDANNSRLLQNAFDLGINYFDTADLYDHGQNEIIVGKALKEKRKELLIATKVGNQWKEDGSGWQWNPTKKYILQAVEASLQRLQTDYIDLYQLHGGTMEDPIHETIEAFELLVQQGKIRYYGISSIRPVVIREWIQYSNALSVMMQYSLLDRRPEESMLSFLQDHQKSVLVRGSLAQGLLAGKTPKPYLDHEASTVSKAAALVKELSTSRTPAQTAQQFVLHHPAVTSAVTGIRNQQQLEEAVGTLTAPQLTPEEYHSLQNILPANLYKEHR